jgi:hypothetical protein
MGRRDIRKESCHLTSWETGAQSSKESLPVCVMVVVGQEPWGSWSLHADSLVMCICVSLCSLQDPKDQLTIMSSEAQIGPGLSLKCATYFVNLGRVLNPWRFLGELAPWNSKDCKKIF